MRDDDFFWDGARVGQLLIQCCADCGTLRHPPSPMCARCNSLNIDIVESARRGRVLGWLMSRHPTRRDAPARIVVRIALDEGPYLIANFPGAAIEDIAEGMRVEIYFDIAEGKIVPQARAVEAVA